MFGRRGQDTNHFKHGHASDYAGLSPTYSSWQSMVGRVTNPTDDRWRYYGGVGVKADPRWLGERGFENFLADVGERPSSKHTLSRFLDSGDYEPGNVEWATWPQQMAERRGKHAMLIFRVWKEQQAQQQFEAVAA
jgi:hypothetical protein